MTSSQNNLPKVQKIFIANDHAGFALKAEIIDLLTHQLSQDLDCPFDIRDLGCHDETSVDYPDYAVLLSQKMKEVLDDDTEGSVKGILVCGTGTGMAISANRFPWIRASVYESSLKVLELARQKNHINVMCIGAKYSNVNDIDKALKIFLTTTESQDRHQRRVKKMGLISA